MKRHFDPVSLRIFVAICEEGNLAKAAERECIVASAVSKRFAALESDVGVPLLDRARQTLEPTAAGNLLLRQAREILATMERLHVDLSEFIQGLNGNVRGVASLSALSGSLPDDVADFLARHDRVSVRLDELYNVDIPGSVREGRADFGVCWTDTDLDGLQTLPYRQDHLCALVWPEHPLADQDKTTFLATLAWPQITVQPTSAIQTKLRRHASAAGATLNARVQVTTFDAACRNVAAHLGLSIVPREVVARHAAILGLRLVPLSDAWATRNFGICVRSHDALPPSVRLLVDHLHACAGE